MINLKQQKGVGLVEVLVALILLAIGVLGFSALQMKAVEATSEAMNQVNAMNIARDLSERIRINRDGLLFYKKVSEPEICSSETDDGIFCTAQQMAEYDFDQVSDKALDLGMELAILDCKGSADLKRKCIYVAWEGTTPTDGTASPACTNGAAYLPNAKCIIVEVYNYND